MEDKELRIKGNKQELGGNSFKKSCLYICGGFHQQESDTSSAWGGSCPKTHI